MVSIVMLIDAFHEPRCFLVGRDLRCEGQRSLQNTDQTKDERMRCVQFVYLQLYLLVNVVVRREVTESCSLQSVARRHTCHGSRD